jgi:hypothetical protein
MQIIAVQIETWPLVTALLDRRILSESEALDPARIADALAAIVAQWTARNRL